jgi:alkylation response protein AidB-like acyl-CoA dehydrogenase
MQAARGGELALPAPGHGTVERWRGLARLGRRDLPSARLAEGHVDALAILGEAGATPLAGAAYGVWAARSGGTGAELVADRRGWRLTGTVRFCSGAHLVDRALVVAGSPDGMRLVDVGTAAPGVRPVTGTWHAAAMAASDTDDVEFDDVAVEPDMLVGPPGFYTDRPGFWWGGAGVAAVWLGGAAGITDDVRDALRDSGPDPDPHRLADLAELHGAVAATDALLGSLAAAIDADPGRDHRNGVLTARAVTERTCRTAVDLGPRAAGVSALSGPGRLADRVADLQVFSRQHHGGRDLAELGRRLLEPSPALAGCP